MFRARERSLILFFLLFDLLLLNVAISVTGYFQYLKFWGLSETALILSVGWFITYLPFINEKLFQREKFRRRITSNLSKWAIFMGISSFLIIIFDKDHMSRTVFIGSGLLFLSFRFVATYFYSYLISQRKNGQYYGTILIVGANDNALKVLNYYRENPDLGYVLGCLSDRTINNKINNVIGNFEQLEEIFNKHHINEIIIALDLTNDKKIKFAIDLAEKYGIRPRVVPNYHSMFQRQIEAENLNGIPVVNVRGIPVEQYANRFWKRAFDVAFSSFALLLASPIMLLIAMAIKLESKGPVFYKPLRCGRKGAYFTLFKFRSMRENDDAKFGSKSTVINDPRVTRVGKIIRKTNLDELPQFINVLLNEMSVVGPRPHRTNLNKSFQEKISTYMVRHYTKPGITGWAQVNGWRGPTETKIQYVGRALHDLWYIENWTFGLDLYIIFLTVFGKKVRKNAF
jgi:putative colanic acid biosynthesis UDP-glucose lipid carrier transferase